MAEVKDVEKLLKDVKFFNGRLYYKVNTVEESKKLINARDMFKKFIVLNITQGELLFEHELEDRFLSFLIQLIPLFLTKETRQHLIGVLIYFFQSKPKVFGLYA